MNAKHHEVQPAIVALASNERPTKDEGIYITEAQPEKKKKQVDGNTSGS